MTLALSSALLALRMQPNYHIPFYYLREGAQGPWEDGAAKGGLVGNERRLGRGGLLKIRAYGRGTEACGDLGALKNRQGFFFFSLFSLAAFALIAAPPFLAR